MLLHPGARYFLGEALKSAVGIRSYQQDVPSFKVSNSGGICKLEYTVKTYDGINAPVCDPSICAGRHKLKNLINLKPLRRWSPYDEASYLGIFPNISGWLQVS
jgi:hypothetical protein